MKTIVGSLLLGLATSVLAESPADPAAMAGIDQLREGLIESFRAGDVERLVTYLDPEVVVTWQNGELCRGPEGVRAFYERMMGGDKPVVREVKSDPEVLGRHVYGDWAVSWGNLRDHFILTDGSDLPFNSVFTATIAKSEDRWLVRSFHVSVNSFDNPVLELAARKTALWTGGGGAVAGLLLGLLVARIRKSGRSG